MLIITPDSDTLKIPISRDGGHMYRYMVKIGSIINAGRSDGTGRRARLKIACLMACGFDSHLRHMIGANVTEEDMHLCISVGRRKPQLISEFVLRTFG